jgi:hypothetical protein
MSALTPASLTVAAPKTPNGIPKRYEFEDWRTRHSPQRGEILKPRPERSGVLGLSRPASDWISEPQRGVTIAHRLRLRIPRWRLCAITIVAPLQGSRHLLAISDPGLRRTSALGFRISPRWGDERRGRVESLRSRECATAKTPEGTQNAQAPSLHALAQAIKIEFGVN